MSTRPARGAGTSRIAAYLLLQMLCLLVFALGAAPAGAMNVDAATNGVELDGELKIWRDPTRSASIDEADKAASTGKFHSPHGLMRSRGYSRDAWWFRFVVHNDSPQTIYSLIEYTDGLIGSVTLYTRPLGSNGPWQLQAFRNSQGEENRPLSTIRPVFREPLAGFQSKEVMLQVVFNGHDDIAGPIYSDLRLWGEQPFFRANNHEMFLLGGMIGIMLLVAFGAITGFAATRDKAFLYYGLNLVMLTISFHSATGVWPLLLWHGYFSFKLLFFCSGIYFICAAQFVRHYLQVSRFSPWLDRALLCIVAIGAVSSVAALLDREQFALEALNIGGIGFLIYIAASIAAIRNRVPGAKLFLAAWATYSVSLTVTWGLRDYGLIEHDAFSYRFIFIGIIIEIMLFSVAMALRVRELRRRKEAAESAYRLHLIAEAERLESLVAQRTAELETARSQAETANHAKTTFLAHVSHEIRTPLTAILGYVERLSDERDLNPHQAQWLSHIGDSSEYLLSLIGNVLDVSKLEAGHIKLYETPMSMAALVRQLHGLFHEQAARKGVAFEIIAPDQGWFRLDAGKWRQILVNLVGNAIKLTEEGKVAIHLAHEARAGQGHWLVAKVIDTGPGIATKDIEMIFAPFEQAAAGRRVGGAGLGLSICRDFTHLMGGHIELDSTPGQGATFTVNVPVTPAQPVHESGHQDWQGVLSGRTVLIAEDQPLNRDLLSDILLRAGANVISAEDGIEAMGIWRANERIDIILADFHMPFMNGVRLAQSLRKLGYKGQYLLVSAGHSPDAEHLAASGVDGWVTKPFTRDQLLRALMEKNPAPLQTQLPATLEEAAAAMGYTLEKAIPFAQRGLDRITVLLQTLADEETLQDRSRHAHSAKGIAGQIGMLKLMRALEALEQTPEAMQLAVAQLELAAACAIVLRRARQLAAEPLNDGAG
ncbi:signal transduction histidine kinase/CheY-like chemotaxis protein/HPt (histidine-containing phosphotransfer) domain-containing protein [Silvimonas terrae]|uniref:histidine kinase n=1 Tax=Silvimonas terrae TaxID=300266 RepID=A0A840R855_9NEIS|nr:hybrid sensor histidine kinase/response regulator [Silvimonas terrae]MBB5189519.1 signal transduction histidine kinase/CheY-like chemotaxis protein/HPt (histidine-containing phosphotransfer) domain-containing protein [Silvimonas terrae]